MNTLEHLLVTASEECMEAMEALYTDDESSDIAVELRDIIAVVDLINQSGELGVMLPLAIEGHRIYFKDEIDTAEADLHKVLLKIQYYTSKSLRFGLTDIKPGSDKSNEQELQALMMKFAYHIQTLAHKNPAISYDEIYSQEGIRAKQKKVLANMAFAINNGTLQVIDNKKAITPQETVDMIKGLCEDEAALINNLFYRDESLGVKALKDAITSFEGSLKQSNPMFIENRNLLKEIEILRSAISGKRIPYSVDGKECYMSDIIKTVVVIDDDEDMDYFGIANTGIVNDLIFDSGNGLCEHDVRVMILIEHGGQCDEKR